MGNADIHRWADTNALIAPRVITGTINGPAFDTCIETQPAPALDPGTVVILDNLSTHKSPPAARRRGPETPRLPVPVGARTFDALFEAPGNICDLFDPQECWNFIKAAG